MPLAFVVAFVASLAERAEGLEWVFVPYAWGVGPKVDITVNNDPVLSGETSFRDVLDKLQFGFMGYLEARGERTGFYLDGFYANLGSERSTKWRPPLPGGSSLESDLRFTLLDAVVFFRPKGGERGFDLLAGARITDMNEKIDIRLPGPAGLGTTVKANETLVDGIVGFRYSTLLAEKWDLALRGDIGAGDSDLTWDAVATFGRSFGKKGNKSLRFGWKYLVSESSSEDDGVRLEGTTTLSGPVLGLQIGF